MAVIPMTGSTGLPGQSQIVQQNCVFDVVNVTGASSGNTFTYTLKGQLIDETTIQNSIIGLPARITPTVSSGVLTLTPDADIGTIRTSILLIYKK